MRRRRRIAMGQRRRNAAARAAHTGGRDGATRVVSGAPRSTPPTRSRPPTPSKASSSPPDPCPSAGARECRTHPKAGFLDLSRLENWEAWAFPLPLGRTSKRFRMSAQRRLSEPRRGSECPPTGCFRKQRSAENYPGSPSPHPSNPGRVVENTLNPNTSIPSRMPSQPNPAKSQNHPSKTLGIAPFAPNSNPPASAQTKSQS